MDGWQLSLETLSDMRNKHFLHFHSFEVVRVKSEGVHVRNIKKL